MKPSPPAFTPRSWAAALAALFFIPLIAAADRTPEKPADTANAGTVKARTLRALFIGNSFTGRHNLSQVIKSMAEEGNPGLHVDVTTVIYGGRTLRDHWRLGTQNFVRLSSLSEDEEKATIASLEKAIQDDPKDSHARSALTRHRELLAGLGSRRAKWDVVVLQSYRDDLGGEASSYAEYAPRFAEIARANGARVILYETTPLTQNAEALAAPPDPAPVLKKAREIAALADRIDAAVVPMALVALRCQLDRPDFTLRFINDGHLNHTMAYLTACTFYAALFDRSPEGLRVDSITDIRFLDDDPKNRDKDRDGQPITRTFSKKDAADLQRIAWDAFNEFREMRRSGGGDHLGKEPATLAGLASRHLEPLVGGEKGATAVAFGIVRADETLVGGFGRKGLDDAKLPDGGTLFEIGSVSKVFTGILLADAVARGEVALDDPVQKHLPEGWAAPDFEGREIRMVDLSTHRSALPRIPLMLPADPENPYADYTLEFLRQAIAGTTLQYKPGTKYAYSNLAVGLLGNALVHRAGAADYEALLVQRIATPLKLGDTKVALDDQDRARLAQPVAPNGRPAKNWDIPALAGAGAIRSTAGDMVRFIRANLRPESSALRAAIELAQEPRADIAESDGRMALGWHVEKDGSTLWHNGQTGGYHAYLAIHPKTAAGVIILATGKAGKVDAAGSALMRELSRGTGPR